MLYFLIAMAMFFQACGHKNRDQAGVEAGNTKVAGILLDGGGNPVINAPVRLVETSSLAMSHSPKLAKQTVAYEDTTDSEGRFDFLVPFNLYQLQVGNGTDWKGIMEIEVDETSEIDLGNLNFEDLPNSSFPDAVSSSSSTQGISSEVQMETFIDSRDGQSYPMILIGTNLWMAQGLNYSGDDGMGGRAFTLGWCYGQDSVDHGDYASCSVQGRLYDWAEAMAIDSTYISQSWNGSDSLITGICPEGWHLPSTAEWLDLANSAETLEYSNWRQAGDLSLFWSATESSSSLADCFDFGSTLGSIIRRETTKYEGHTIRCIQNNHTEINN